MMVSMASGPIKVQHGQRLHVFRHGRFLVLANNPSRLDTTLMAFRRRFL
jgi:hypothetical protein